MADALDQLSPPIAPPAVSPPGLWDTFWATPWAQALPWLAVAVVAALGLGLALAGWRRWQRVQALRARRRSLAHIAAAFTPANGSPPSPPSLAAGAQALADWLRQHGLPLHDDDSLRIHRLRFGPMLPAEAAATERAAMLALVERLQQQLGASNGAAA